MPELSQKCCITFILTNKFRNSLCMQNDICLLYNYSKENERYPNKNNFGTFDLNNERSIDQHQIFKV